MLQNDVEIPVPKYFINERAKNLKEREKLLGQVLAKIGPQDGDKVNTFCSPFIYLFIYLGRGGFEHFRAISTANIHLDFVY